MAWISENVSGVSSLRFFPRDVVVRTMGLEFHSLNTTRWPWLRSHCASSVSCVLLPEPSMPSTMNSLPGNPLRACP